MRARIGMLVCAVAGCGNVDAKQSDAGAPIDSTGSDAGTLDAGAICDPTATFDPPVQLAGVNTAGQEYFPRLTADELELYFFGQLGTSSDYNIYRTQRSSVTEPFSAPSPVTPLNTTAPDVDPSVSSDGLTLFFASHRVPSEGSHLYVSTRISRLGEFGAPSELVNVNSTTVTDDDAQVFVTADGQELWFRSSRAGGLGATDLYRATWNGSNFGNVVAVVALNSSAEDNTPTLTADRLTVYLSSTRPGGKGVFDIWMAHRSTTHDGFPDPTPVSELNSTATEYVGWVSPDNCRLYFSSDIAGSFDIYVASRHPM